MGIFIMIAAVVCTIVALVALVALIAIITGDIESKRVSLALYATTVLVITVPLAVFGYIANTRPCVNEASVYAIAKQLAVTSNVTPAPATLVRAYAQLENTVAKFPPIDGGTNPPYLKGGYQVRGRSFFATVYLTKDTRQACVTYNLATTNWKAFRDACPAK